MQVGATLISRLLYSDPRRTLPMYEERRCTCLQVTSLLTPDKRIRLSRSIEHVPESDAVVTLRHIRTGPPEPRDRGSSGSRSRQYAGRFCARTSPRARPLYR